MADETTYSATCERFPNLQIGDAIQFRDGVFTTTDPAVWERLKQHEWWDILIKEGKPPAPAGAAAAPAAEGASAPPEAEKSEDSGTFGGVHRGARGTR